MNSNMIFVKGALLLALILVAQSLRFILPIPPIILMFIIGTFVNAFLLIAVRETNMKITAIICVIAPFVAFVQGQLPLAPFIPVVAAGNFAYSLTVKLLYWHKQFVVALAAALAKTATLFLGLQLVLSVVALPEPAAAMLTTALSWPQLITAFCGTFLGYLLLSRLPAKQIKL